MTVKTLTAKEVALSLKISPVNYNSVLSLQGKQVIGYVTKNGILLEAKSHWVKKISILPNNKIDITWSYGWRTPWYPNLAQISLESDGISRIDIIWGEDDSRTENARKKLEARLRQESTMFIPLLKQTQEFVTQHSQMREQIYSLYMKKGEINNTLGL